MWVQMVCVCVCVNMSYGTCVEVREQLVKLLLSFYLMRTPGIKLKPSGLAASTFADEPSSQSHLGFCDRVVY